MINIRHMDEKEAEALLELRKSIERETSFMLFEPGERKMELRQQQEMVKNLLSRNNSTILVAENDAGQLVGFLSAIGGEANRNKHNVEIVIGILQAYTGQKIGSKLFAQLEIWALSQSVHRLGLGLMASNETALALYTKMGFKMEGRKRDVFYVDEYMMSKLL